MLSLLRFTLWFFVLSTISSAGLFADNTGTISGIVKDKETKRILAGAGISVQNSKLGAVSDRFGSFTIKNVPMGEQTIAVSYLGYETITRSIVVEANKTLSLEFEMESSILESDGVVVEGLRQGQVRALNRQKTAPNIVNVVAADAIGRFPDLNSAEALQRIPSLSIQRDQGEGRYVLIRGTEARLNSVMINGERIPSPEGDVRQVALDVIPSDVLASIEVSKAITPDMDGDAIGGAINLTTKSAFDFDKPIYKLTLAGGYNDIVGDPNFQVAGTLGRQLGDENNIGILVSASYFKTDRGSDNNEMEWLSRSDLDDFPDDFGITVPAATNVIGDLQLRDYVITRERLGISTTVDFRLSESSTLYVRGLFNRFSDDEHRRRGRVRFDKGDYTAVSANGGSISEGNFERELKDRFEEQTIWSVSAGGNSLLGDMTLDYNFSFSHADEDEPNRRDITFELKDIDMTYDISNPDLPRFTGNGFNDASAFEFSDLVIENNKTSDEDFTAGANLTIPYSLSENLGTLKFGLKFRAKNKERINDVKVYDAYAGTINDGDLSLADVVGDFEDDEFLENEYAIGLAPDPDKVENLVDNNLNDFELNTDDSRLDTDPANYEATENIIAAYLMTTLNVGDLMILPGARLEMTNLEYTGNVVEVNAEGDYASTAAVTGDDDYNNILPMLHLKYHLDDATNLRAAWTNTIARPNYYDLAPFRLVNREDEEIERGNTTLEPTESMNVDLFFEHYLESLGILSLGAFYKDLDNIIFAQTRKGIDGEPQFADFDVLTPVNGKTATLFGVEVAWQQQLTFLPGALNGLGIYANYTYTDSKTDIDLGDGATRELTIPGQSEHIANLALSYEKHGFSGRIALNFHGSYVDAVGDKADEDVYYDDHIQLDFSANYEFRKGLRVFAELLNLTDEPLRFFVGDESRPIQREFYSFWGHFGVKLDL